VRKQLAVLPFAEIRVADPEFMQGVPYQAPIDLYVRGDDMRELQRISDELVTRIRRIPGAVDVKSTLVAGQPEMVARINRELAADIGFDVGGIAAQLRAMVEGVVPTKLRDGDREHDIRVRLAPEFRNDFGAIARTPLYSPTGAAVRTGDLVTMQPAVGPTSIDREQRRRQLKVGVDLAARPLGDVTADVEKAIAAVKMPANFEAGRFSLPSRSFTSCLHPSSSRSPSRCSSWCRFRWRSWARSWACSSRAITSACRP
jgi:HAE1 family hydrophobic/amphiphilic exporter-1